MQSTWQFWTNWWVTLATALATFAAVFVALFGEWLRAKMFAPRLSLALENQHGTSTPVTIQAPNGETRSEQARYYHLRVSNELRWPKATQVRVQLIRVEEPGPDGKLQMKWTGEVPLRWMHQEIFPLERTVGPDALCDFVSVIKGKWLELHPLIMPSNLADLARRASAADLTVSVQVSSGETASRIFRFRISWDGLWADGEVEMAKHLVLKESQHGAGQEPPEI